MYGKKLLETIQWLHNRNLATKMGVEGSYIYRYDKKLDVWREERARINASGQWVHWETKRMWNRDRKNVLKKFLERKSKLLGGESNPGLLCDRQGYSPLYYQGHLRNGSKIVLYKLIDGSCTVQIYSP